MNRLETYIVYLDDAAYAHEQLARLLAQPSPKRWVFVACAPRMTRRIGKWLSHTARQSWREKWCDKLFDQFLRKIPRTDHVFCEVADGPLPQYTQMLLEDLGDAQVIDARRPKFGAQMQPVVSSPISPGSASSQILPTSTLRVIPNPAVLRPAMG